MKKVLFTATVDSHILHFHIPYLQYFKENGYEVHVATNGDEEIPYCDVKHRISFERNPLKINNIKAIKDLKKIIDTEKFEIIHCHTPMGSVVTRIAAKKARKKQNTKVIYTAHGFHFFKGAPLLNWVIYYPIEKWMSKYTDCLITINEEDYNLAQKKFKVKRIELINGVGVDREKFDFTMTEEEKINYRKECGLEKDDFIIIYVAELSKRKNQGMLIESIKGLKAEGQNIKVLLVGQDSLDGYYQNVVKKLNLEESIKFLGYRKDIPKLLKISDLYVSTSNQEGLPVNIMEAILCNLPIIATDCRGNHDLIVNNKNGFIVPKGDTEELSNKIKYLKENISEFVDVKTDEYCLDKIKEKYIEIYKDIIKKNILYLRSTSIINDSRASKEIDFYKKDYNVSAIGWNRQQLEIKDEKNVRYIMYNKKSQYGLGMRNIFKLMFFELWINRITKKHIKNCEIVHACDFDTAYISNRLARKYKKIFIYDIYDYYIDCHNLGPLNKIVEKLDVKTINRADIVLICTEKRIEQINKANPKKVVVIHNSPQINIKPKNNYKEDKVKICYVGILQEDRLLSEIGDIIKENKKLELHIGGFGLYEDKFKKLAEENDNIFFYGSMKYEDVLKLENECDILFATYSPKIKNHKYSAPNKVYEAMALGKPIIVCNDTGIDELVKRLKIGKLINYDAKEFEKAVSNISIDKYNEMSQNGIKNYIKEYSWEMMTEKLKKEIENI